MRQYGLITFCSICLLVLAGKLSAQPVFPVTIPDKVKNDIIKRHPNAQDLTAENEIHFSHYLLEVSFGELGGDAEFTELFRENGKLFAKESLLANLEAAPSIVLETLQKTFPGYQLNKAKLVANPEGIGEEYELYLLVGEIDWKVCINEKGNIVQKERYLK